MKNKFDAWIAFILLFSVLICISQGKEEIKVSESIKRLKRAYGALMEPVWDVNFPIQDPVIVVRGNGQPPTKIGALLTQNRGRRQASDTFSLYLVFIPPDNGSRAQGGLVGCLARFASGQDILLLYKFDVPENDFIRTSIDHFRKEGVKRTDKP